MKELGCWVELFFSTVDLAECSHLSSWAGLRLLWSKIEAKYGPVWGWWPKRNKSCGICRNSSMLHRSQRKRERQTERIGQSRVSANHFICQVIPSTSESDSEYSKGRSGALWKRNWNRKRLKAWALVMYLLSIRKSCPILKYLYVFPQLLLVRKNIFVVITKERAVPPLSSHFFFWGEPESYVGETSCKLESQMCLIPGQCFPSGPSAWPWYVSSNTQHS